MNKRYYCPNCKSELILTNKLKKDSFTCVVCAAATMPLIPDLEPLADWEKRMGMPCPDTMPVWRRTLYPTGPTEWFLCLYWQAKLTYKGVRVKYEILIANGANKPGEEYQG